MTDYSVNTNVTNHSFQLDAAIHYVISFVSLKKHVRALS